MYRGERVAVGEEYFPRTLPSGRKVSEVSVMGVHPSGTTACEPPPPQTTSAPNKPGFPFKDDTSVPPWLYGNWWALDSDVDAGPQLIGIGVRLGTRPEIEAAEGNTKHKVWYRGSHLRLRTDDGMFELTQYAYRAC